MGAFLQDTCAFQYHITLPPMLCKPVLSGLVDVQLLSLSCLEVEGRDTSSFASS